MNVTALKERDGMRLQHQDINIGPGDYRHLDKDELLVTKIFFTLQGEGPYAGWPAVFLRLAGCNRGRKDDMGCRFCDTAFYFGQGTRMKFHQIINQFKNLVPNSLRDFYPLIVITGGEPMMQDNLTAFIAELGIHEFFDVQIESNGDRLARNFVESPSAQDVKLVVSPKVVGGLYRPLRTDVYTRLDILKVLISANPDSPYHEIPEYAHDLAFGGLLTKPVYLSPMAVYRTDHEPGKPVSAWADEPIDREATRANYTYAAALAMQQGFRLSMQQHLFFDLE